MTILARASRQRAAALPASVRAQWESRPRCHATLICLTPGQSEQATAAAGVLGLTTVALLLVSLVAAAGFVVVAHRRLRQLGMLAASVPPSGIFAWCCWPTVPWSVPSPP